MLREDGFLGTGATLGADLNLLAYALLLVPLMVIGFYFARGKKFRNHKYVMTTITLANWVLIASIMAVSYSDNVSPGVPDRLKDSFFLSPTLHAAIALTAQTLATYLVLRMWFEKRLPGWVMIKNFKPWMRLTLGLWLTTAALGIITYGIWYLQDEAQAAVKENEVSMQNFSFNPQNLTVLVNTEVVWINNESAPHTVTFDDGSVDSGQLLKGDTFRYRFDTPGTYSIHCAYHGAPGGGMHMTVTAVISLDEIPAATAESTEEIQTEAVPASAVTDVAMEQFAYNPRDLTIAAGTTVTWTNKDAVSHTVTFDDGSEDSGEIPAGAAYSYTFDTPGTYPIYCAYHGGAGGSGMSMVVTVVEAGETMPTKAPAQSTPTTATRAPTATSQPIQPTVTTAPTQTSAAVEVSMINNLFAPKLLTIPAGTAVIWTNKEARVHTVTFDDGTVDSGELAQGEQFEYTFTTPGTYPIYCRLHGGPNGLGMSMTVTVQ